MFAPFALAAALTACSPFAAAVLSFPEDCGQTLAGIPGVDGDVYASIVWDDGTGEALYIGGRFTIAGTAFASGIAKWDGTTFSPLGDGVAPYLEPWQSGAWVNSLEIFDDGSGEALYAAGFFETAGGMQVNSVARWDGQQWSPVGSGLGLNSEARALEVHNDGTGDALYIAGAFTTIEGSPAARVARWNGVQWTTVGTGLGPVELGSSSIAALKTYDSGTGPKLYAGGWWSGSNGAAGPIAVWDGQSWNGTDLESGISDWVGAFEVHDDGTGERLYAAGNLSAGGAPSMLAELTGTGWATVGDRTAVDINNMSLPFGIALQSFRNSTENRLYLAGAINPGDVVPGTRNFVAWDGEKWLDLNPGTEGPLRTLSVFDDGTGPAIYAGGRFRRFGTAVNPSIAVRGIGRWDGTDWCQLAPGFTGYRGEESSLLSVNSLLPISWNGEEQLLAAGTFVAPDDRDAQSVARWDGTSWYALGSGLREADVYALAAGELGDMGMPCVAAGSFSDSFTPHLNNIAAWDGTEWIPLGAGIDGSVYSLAFFDDGNGMALYAAGTFQSADNKPARNIARWDGSAWVEVGGGTNGGVRSLQVYDDGTGPSLYAGGFFNEAGTVPAQYLARWDGSNWSEVGGGTDAAVEAMYVLEDKSGSTLCIGGRFSTAGGVPTEHFAKWNGTGWTPLPAPNQEIFIVNSIHSMVIGGETRLFAGIALNGSKDGLSRRGSLLMWDGSDWISIRDTGRLDGFEYGTRSGVASLAPFSLDGKQSMIAGGSFQIVDGAVEAHLTAYTPCDPRSCPADVTGDGAVDLADLNLVLSHFGQQTASGDANGDGLVDLADLNAVLAAFDSDCP